METFFAAEANLTNKKGYLADAITQKCFAKEAFSNIW